MNQPFMYKAEELFELLLNKPDFVLLDVRNEKDFKNFYIEAPSIFPYINIPYYEFIEDVSGSIAKIPANQKVRIVCSKEGSAQYVAEQVCAKGFTDVGYLQGGIVAWGNVLIPKKISANNAGYELYQCIRPGKGSCSYVAIADGEAMVFDPSRNVEFYKNFAEKKKCKITKIFETHRQADYISGGIQLSADTGATIFANAIDFDGAHFAYEGIKDMAFYSFSGGTTVQAIHTPGHTMGSTSYLIDNKYLLTGDTIFISTAGRPDLGGKSEKWSRFLYLTLTLKFRDFNDATLICPGHYSNWQESTKKHVFVDTLGNLRKNNIAFKSPTELHFREFIEENLRPQPGTYAKIRRINGGWRKPSDEDADIMDLGKHECGASNYGKKGVSAEVLRGDNE
ncbi:MAG: MBL fold metallo-hydrolase [Desulfobulbaceae bacterium]|uniref:MBL fold metallo-hydrolase n=1 Tax=Candidatus Desulfobia pelagia TaxID=2841692 RepID=A0A8J6NE87_9BACT|nr:MBL fold metallo-hydrolase [Candidatus Desulfobia pelagia]